MTTVHSRTDSRIVHREIAGLASKFGKTIHLFVQDGLGDATASANGLTIVDTGRRRNRIARAIFGSMAMFRSVRRARPDIVHFHDPELVPIAILLKLLGAAVIYDVHEDLPRQIRHKTHVPAPLKPVVAAMASAVETIGAIFFDGIVAATPTIAARFPRSKTIVVFNYPSLDEFPAVPLTYQSRKAQFCYVGGIARTRGSIDMVRAMANLDTDAQLVLAGPITPENHRFEIQSEAGFKRAVFAGWLDREATRDLMLASRAGLVLLHPTPAYVDAYPVKLFEYMAAGLPVVASDTKINRSIIAGADSGLLVEPENPGAAAAAMKWILDNPEQAEEMGRRGRAAIEERFNWRSELAKLIDLYEKIMAQRAGNQHG
ncbi:MAG: glycosyltransferase family 4 protein [Phyllobacteriaceae bacterium]|nr:glycosyltransferase family 4 protein [Phyllobacteriaceae bacterium]